MQLFHDALDRTGFRETRRTSKLVEYQLRSGETVYMLLKNQESSLVVEPKYDAAVRSFSDRRGLKAKPGFYHNIHMNRFPKRVNKGRGPTHFGSKIEFRTS